MKKVIPVLLLTIFLFSIAITVAGAATRVSGYYRKSGTYVAPHYRSTANHKFSDNYSTRGNYNPYTGKKGYKTHR